MTVTERAQVVVAARLLRATSKLEWLSTGLTLIAALALVSTRWLGFGEVVVVTFGALARWYAVRIDFDARLFEDAAADLFTKDDLDAALAAMSLVPQDKLGRGWDERCRGARRLLTMYALVVAAQVVAFLATFVVVAIMGRR
jgi:hypothetical protein